MEMRELDKSEMSFKTVSATRCGKLGHCTHKMNEIKSMMSANADAGDVKKEMSDFHKILNDFKLCHESVQTLLSDDMEENENLDLCQPKVSKYKKFLADVDTCG